MSKKVKFSKITIKQLVEQLDPKRKKEEKAYEFSNGSRFYKKDK